MIAAIGCRCASARSCPRAPYPACVRPLIGSNGRAGCEESRQGGGGLLPFLVDSRDLIDEVAPSRATISCNGCAPFTRPWPSRRPAGWLALAGGRSGALTVRRWAAPVL